MYIGILILLCYVELWYMICYMYIWYSIFIMVFIYNKLRKWIRLVYFKLVCLNLVYFKLKGLLIYKLDLILLS